VSDTYDYPPGDSPQGSLARPRDPSEDYDLRVEIVEATPPEPRTFYALAIDHLYSTPGIIGPYDTADEAAGAAKAFKVPCHVVRIVLPAK